MQIMCFHCIFINIGNCDIYISLIKCFIFRHNSDSEASTVSQKDTWRWIEWYEGLSFPVSTGTRVANRI